MSLIFPSIPRPITDASTSARNRSAAGKPRARGEMLAGALAYAAKDYHVLPLEWLRAENRCSCGKDSCSSPGAHPFTMAATAFRPCGSTDEWVIKQCWRSHVNCNLAISLPADVVIIDVNDDSGQDLIEKLGLEELPATVEQRTQRGRQLWYRIPNGVHVPNGSLAVGVTLHTALDFVIMPPSSHLEGYYEWVAGRALLERDLAPLPQSLCDLLITRAAPAVPASRDMRAPASRAKRAAKTTKARK